MTVLGKKKKSRRPQKAVKAPLARNTIFHGAKPSDGAKEDPSRVLKVLINITGSKVVISLTPEKSVEDGRERRKAEGSSRRLFSSL